VSDERVEVSELRVLFEDREVLVVDKPEGIATIPERSLEAPSLRRLLEQARGEELFVVHRLDKEVSGVVVFARTAETHRELSMAFEARRVHKTYLAVVHGAIARDAFEVDAPIAQFGSGRMGVRERGGKASQTRFAVVRRTGAFCLVEAEPVTGRRHQIRVHAYHAGHPIVGDLRYGERVLQSRFERLFLHSMRLSLPLSGQERTFEAPVPEAFERVVGLGVRRG
jgi:tRNA pseudouridine32 synthase/23S rRNA pseudouridine746 synthase